MRDAFAMSECDETFHRRISGDVDNDAAQPFDGIDALAQ